ncbi:hypothetical protein ACM26V_00840 [Salipaludibacillus sp. HK11]|uniref:hypothetical protein n=1 Tax=Salipaludibacillus sp. HK11 TaxID=3394320 RepID=UPI0039FCE2B9
MSILGLVVLSLHMITTPVSADILVEDSEESVQEGVTSQCVDYHVKTLQPHLIYYLELVVEKHRPDLLEEWREINSEREAINKKLKEYSKEKQKDLCENISEDWYDKHAIVQEHFLTAVTEREAEQIKINIQHILTLKKNWNAEMKEVIKGEN